MSPGPLSIKTRIELETRVLAAALKISLQKGDLVGARLAHEHLSKIMKPEAPGTESAVQSAIVQSAIVQPAVMQPSATPPEPVVSAPPVFGDLVRSPIGTPQGSAGPIYQQPGQPAQTNVAPQTNFSSAADSARQAPDERPETSVPKPEMAPAQSAFSQPELSPLIDLSPMVDLPPISGISPLIDLSPMVDLSQTPQNAQLAQADTYAQTSVGLHSNDMPDVDFSLQATEPSEAQSSASGVSGTVPEEIPFNIADALSPPQVELSQPDLLPLPPLQASQSNIQPTAADALHRSIVNTPMRASASNIPAVRTIDESVLLGSNAAVTSADANQVKLTESLAKIEAAMGISPTVPTMRYEQSSAETSSGSDVQQENSDDEAKGVDHQYQGLYRLLGVSQMSPYEEIHKNFLRRVRLYIRQINVTRRPEKLELLHNLRKIWIAHDILTDPVTRTDYDFRDLGLRGDVESSATPAPEDKQQAQQTNRTPTRIGELLQCAGLLEPAELQIACDMHKAMPEVQFGTFLVKQGFIGERDLESVLLGQKLLRAGVISVAQFQVAMELSQSRGHTIGETLVERGYVTQDGLDKAVETIDAPQDVSVNMMPLIVDAIIREEPENGSGLSAALMPKITDLVDFEPMEQSLSSGNALTELLGGSVSGGAGTNVSSMFGSLPLAQDIANAAPPAVPVTSEQSTHALIMSQAVPSWKDQLDWDSPETAETQQPQELVANVGVFQENATEALTDYSESARSSGINLGHASPSWKDQLDWDSPEESVENLHTAVPIETGLHDETPGSPSQFVITSENAPISESVYPTVEISKQMEFQPANKRASIDITGDHERYSADDSMSHSANEKSENGEEAETHLANQQDNAPGQQESLPGDDWVDIDPTMQMETAAHLQPITMDNLTLKQGRSSKKNKDKKKHKN